METTESSEHFTEHISQPSQKFGTSSVEMPWRPLPRIAVAVATYPFPASSPADLPLEIGDDLYIIEQGGQHGSWFRGYLVAPPSLLAGLTSVEGQTLEARVFSGIFPRCCVEIREHLGDPVHNVQTQDSLTNGDSQKLDQSNGPPRRQSSLAYKNGIHKRESDGSVISKRPSMNGDTSKDLGSSRWPNPSSQQKSDFTNGQSIARKLSHMSITSSRSRNSGLPTTPTMDAPRDPHAKRPQAPVPMLKIGDEIPTSSSEPLVDEIASCLREWHSKNLHELLLARRYSVLEQISDLVARLDLARRQLLHGVLTTRELATLREETVWNLVGGNKMLCNEVIVRDPKQRGRLLTGDDTPVELSKLQSTMSLLDRPPVFQHDPVNLYHLMVELRAFDHSHLISPSLTFHLCARNPGEAPKTLTEYFAIDVPSNEDFEIASSTGKLRTLFTELTSVDIGDVSRPGTELYLVVKVQANQNINGIMTRRYDETSSPPRPTTGAARSSSPVKGGRQSVMWAQKQFGSVRNRKHLPKSSQSPSSSHSSMPREGEHRLNTLQNSRPSTQQGSQYVKRNVGVGVVNLKHAFGHTAAADQLMSIWAPARTFQDTQIAMDDHWEELIRDIVTSPNGVYTKAKAIEHVRLGLQSFADPDAVDLINKTPTLLQNIVPTPKTGFPGVPSKARSDIYINISEAVLPPQALLSHPERGTVPISSSLDFKNIQLTLEVRKKSGERLDDCIFPSSNSQGQTAWRTPATERGEPWNQMIKLVIPTADVPEAHLIMSIADAPGFPFALAWMPLWIEDAFIKDGPHAPLLYLYDRMTSSSEKGRAAYMAFPWSSKGRDGDEREETLTGPVATLKLETNLCSTSFSQDKILLGILNWQSRTGDGLLHLLNRFTFVPEIEIVKLVGDVLNALFSILVANSGKDDFEDAVFNALVTVLGIVHDRRFTLGPFVDDYAESKFDHPYATPCLIRSFFRLLTDPADPNKSRRVRATFKVGRQILKLIFCAREKQRVREAGIGATTQSSFKRDLKGIFDAFEALMKDPSPSLIGNKTLVVQHMPGWLPELKASFSEEEILQIATSFVDTCTEVQGKLILYKLVLILNLSDNTLFSQDNIRRSIVDRTPKWIYPYWGLCSEMSNQWREQIRLCCTIASRQADEPGFEGSYYIGKTIQSYNVISSPQHEKKDSLSILFPSGYPFPSKAVTGKAQFDEALIELAALLAKLAGTTFASPVGTPESGITSMMLASLEVIISILSGHAFPKSWLSLYVYHHKSMLQVLESLFNAMATNLIPSPDDADNFNTELWSKFLTTLLTLVRSDTLALETFPEQKRRAVWKIAGDVREQGAALLKRSWEAIGWGASIEEQNRYGLEHLGGFQVQYVPNLVGPIVELCLSVHEGLRSVAVKVLQSMIISEWTLNEDLSVIQAEMIECLDALFKSKNFGESMVQKMFVNELLDLFEPLARMPLDPLWQAIRDMVSTIDELLELLAAVHSSEITEALQIMNTLQLMNFLKDMQEEHIFIRYVHQLAEVQAKFNNKTEAGLALRLHADQYNWESTIVPALSDPAYPAQTAFDRKELLYFDMIRYFEEGAAWDCALASYLELANQYELAHYDFAKLARTQRSMATIYETISRGDWQAPRFFRVIYHGLGFPSSLRDRQFIYEGEPAERQVAFTDRMRQLHPSAQILPKGEAEELEGQYLQISPVSTYRDLEHPIYQQPRVAQSTRDFITASRPDRFAVTSKRHSPATGVENQWIEKTLYSTRESFPTILRRSEIIAIDVIRLSPLQTAVERTSRKTAELATLEKRILNGDEAGFSSLTENIISSVDPASAVTVAQYRQLLPIRNDDDEEDVSEVPTLSPLENALQIALLDHVSTLKHCLSHYSRPAQLGTQASLLDSLHVSFAPEIAILGPHEPSTYQLLSSSPPRSPTGVPSATTSRLTNGNGIPAPRDQLSEPKPRPLSRLNFGMLKGSVSKPNGFTSAPSDDGSSSGNMSHAVHSAHSPRQNSTTADTTVLPSSEIMTPERPVTAHSGKSGKVRKRLSLLGLGRAPSTKEKFPRRGDMRQMIRE